MARKRNLSIKPARSSLDTLVSRTLNSRGSSLYNSSIHIFLGSAYFDPMFIVFLIFASLSQCSTGQIGKEAYHRLNRVPIEIEFVPRCEVCVVMRECAKVKSVHRAASPSYFSPVHMFQDMRSVGRSVGRARGGRPAVRPSGRPSAWLAECGPHRRRGGTLSVSSLSLSSSVV